MEGNVRVDISGESPHEKSLLEIQRDLLPRHCDECTEEFIRVVNISALETAIQILGISGSVRDDDRIKEEYNFNVLKGKVLAKIVSKLESAAKERYKIAKSSFDFGMGDSD